MVLLSIILCDKVLSIIVIAYFRQLYGKCCAVFLCNGDGFWDNSLLAYELIGFRLGLSADLDAVYICISKKSILIRIHAPQIEATCGDYHNANN